MNCLVGWSSALIVAFLAVGGFAYAGEEFGPKPLAPLEGGDGIPKIQIENERYDWGTVFQGEPVEHSFKITNSGDAPLRILKVKPG